MSTRVPQSRAMPMGVLSSPENPRAIPGGVGLSPGDPRGVGVLIGVQIRVFSDWEIVSEFNLEFWKSIWSLIWSFGVQVGV